MVSHLRMNHPKVCGDDGKACGFYDYCCPYRRRHHHYHLLVVLHLRVELVLLRVFALRKNPALLVDLVLREVYFL